MTSEEIARRDEMKRLERCFTTPKGEIDLMEMSSRLPEPVFRGYAAWSRGQRAKK